MPIIHRTSKLQALMPRYVTRFKCVGPDCEDSCCHEWQVSLDKNTFKAYRNASDKGLAKAVQLLPEPRTNMEHARIVHNAGDAGCPLLEDKLCGVHKRHGDAALSHTCFTYPRAWTQMQGQCEQVLELSCPEAARQALLSPDAFDFVEDEMRVRPDLVRIASVKPGFAPELASDVRIFCINLLRIEGLELWQRLAVLGLFCESLGGPMERQDNAAIRSLIGTFEQLLDNGGLLDSLAELQPNHSAQAMVFSTLWEGMNKKTANASRARVIREVFAGLGVDPATGEVEFDALVENYSRGVARLPEALLAAPHLLEHYLLNELFQNLFPFDTATPFDSFLRLVARFGLLRLMLAARCNTDGPLPDAHALAQTVQVHCRRFNHDLPFVAQVDSALRKHDWARLDKLYALLRS